MTDDWLHWTIDGSYLVWLEYGLNRITRLQNAMYIRLVDCVRFDEGDG